MVRKVLWCLANPLGHLDGSFDAHRLLGGDAGRRVAFSCLPEDGLCGRHARSPRLRPFGELIHLVFDFGKTGSRLLGAIQGGRRVEVFSAFHQSETVASLALEPGQRLVLVVVVLELKLKSKSATLMP